jgi:hypothetical protein
MFLRNEKGHPVGCLAMFPGDQKTKTDKVSYQISVLNPNDDFNRKLARDIAVGRLKKRPVTVQLKSETQLSIHDSLKVVMEDLAASDMPNQAKKAALLWLRAVSA